MTPSKYQQAIFDWVRDGQGNAIAEAVAGSGKTTTLEIAVGLIPSDARVLVLAFNRHIREELQRRFHGMRNVTVATLNSFGFSACKYVHPGSDLDDDKSVKALRHYAYRINHPVPAMASAGGHADAELWPGIDLSDDAAELIAFNAEVAAVDPVEAKRRYKGAKGVYKRLVDILRATGTHSAIAWRSVAGRYGIDVDEVPEEEIDLLLPPLYHHLIHDVSCFDFTDQIFMPVYHNWPIRRFDFVLGDEVQDWSAVNTELALRAIAPGGRFLGVGDSKQAIYSFRGASFDAIPQLIRATNATTLPLSICYRCPASVVAEARKIVPQIEARPDAPAGQVAHLHKPDYLRNVKAGDLVLCRTTAPLIQGCFEQLRLGRLAVVKGREIGDQLASLAERLADGDMGLSSDEWLDSLRTWEAREVEKCLRLEQEEKAEAIRDKSLTLSIFAAEVAAGLGDEAKSGRFVPALLARIRSLFSDSGHADRQITFSTVHRAKGLEQARVWILRPDLLPHPLAKGESRKQEDNLLYVAITRAQDFLGYVHEKATEDDKALAAIRREDREPTLFEL